MEVTQKQITPFIMFHFPAHSRIIKTLVPLNIMFISNRSIYSCAAVTPVYYECDSYDPTYVFAKSKYISFMEKWMEL